MSSRPPSIRKVTPILIVDEIEPALALWTGALGYDKSMRSRMTVAPASSCSRVTVMKS